MKLEDAVRVRQCLHQFWQAEEAQDLIEYTLIVAAVALIVVGILSMFSSTTAIIWSHDNTMLSQAISVASPS
jgi:Flp pilus assembly pilin Flp